MGTKLNSISILLIVVVVIITSFSVYKLSVRVANIEKCACFPAGITEINHFERNPKLEFSRH